MMPKRSQKVYKVVLSGIGSQKLAYRKDFQIGRDVYMKYFSEMDKNRKSRISRTHLDATFDPETGDLEFLCHSRSGCSVRRGKKVSRVEEGGSWKVVSGDKVSLFKDKDYWITFVIKEDPGRMKKKKKKKKRSVEDGKKEKLIKTSEMVNQKKRRIDQVEDVEEGSEKKKRKIDVEEEEESKFPKYKHPGRSVGAGDTTHHGDWRNSLLKILKDEGDEKFKSINEIRTFYTDENFLWIYDPYPKAPIHLLCIFKKDINDVTHLVPSDVKLLKKAEDLGKDIMKHLKKTGVDDSFRLGFHAFPSMRRLHLHLITSSLSKMKNKKEYNKFHEEKIFIPMSRVLKKLGKDTLIRTPKTWEKRITQLPKCHKCDGEFRTLRKLKLHIRCCMGTPHSYEQKD